MNCCKNILLAFVMYAATVQSGMAQSYTVSTFAGPYSLTIGAQATTQPIFATTIVAAASGGFYFTSQGENRVFRVGADGRISVVAGDGTAGFAGDGGPAVAAKLQGPSALAADRAGNLFVADLGNMRVRKIAATGVITTAAGNGSSGFAGDGGQATAAQLYGVSSIAVDPSGNLFIGQGLSNSVRKVTPAGVIATFVGAAISAQLSFPQSLATDAEGNLYIADSGTNRFVRKVTANGIVSIMAGTGARGPSGGDGGPAVSANINPTGVAVNATGEVFIVDGPRIRKVARNGNIGTVVDLGTTRSTDAGVSVPVDAPQAIALDAAGNLLIADGVRIRRLTPTGAVSTVAGNGEHPGFSPYEIAVDGSGSVYVSDGLIPRLQKITAAGVRITISGNSPFTSIGLAVDRAGNIILTGGSEGGIRRITPAGAVQTIVAGNPLLASRAPGSLAPLAVTVDSGGALFVVDAPFAIRKVSPDGAIARFMELNPSQNAFISSLAVDGAGNVFAAVSGANGPTLRKFTPAGLMMLAVELGSITASVDGIAVDGAGSIFFSTRQRVCKVTTNGVFSGVATLDPGAATPASRVGIAVDSVGNVYIGAPDRILKATPGAPSSPSAPCGNGSAPSYTITKYVGGPPPLPARGTPATAQPVAAPFAIAAGAGGAFYVTSREENRVFRVERDGTVSIVAGTGVAGFSGDGGPATAARLSYPSGIAVDAEGNLFIADTTNYRVRKVNTAGVISTFAGTGLQGVSGDGGPALAAQFSFPVSVAIDAAGNLFIGGLGPVRKVSPNGVISTVAGMTPAGIGPQPGLGDGGPATSALLSRTEFLAVDRSGNLFIADSGNDRIRKVDAATGMISTIAGKPGFSENIGDGGPATAAYIGNPQGIAVDGAGNLYIASMLNRRIRKVSPSGIVTTVAGNGGYGFGGDGGPGTAAPIAPAGLALDAAGNLLIADSENNRVRRLSTAGIVSTVLGNGTAHFSGDGGPAIAAEISYPEGLAVDAAGNLYIADRENARIRKVTPGGIITTFAGSGQFDRTGVQPEITGYGGPATSARIIPPGGLAVDAAGNLYFSGQYAPDVWKVATNGILTTVPGSGGIRAERIAVDSTGNLYVAEGSVGHNRVRKIAPNGAVTTIAGSDVWGFTGDGGPAAAAQLRSPKGLAVDAAGNLFIADSGNNRIRKVTPNGVISTVAGGEGFSSNAIDENGLPATSAHLMSPEAIAVDLSGNLFIADYQHFQVRMVTPDGKIWTIAGTGSNGTSANDGPASRGVLGYVRGIAVDRSGNIFLTDTSGYIRKLTPDVKPPCRLSDGSACAAQ